MALIDFKPEHEYALVADSAAIYYLLNDLFVHKKELFGATEPERTKLKADMDVAYNECVTKDGRFMMPFFADEVVEVFNRHHINPLKDIRLVHVAPTALMNEELYELCGHYDETPAGKMLFSHNAVQLSGCKHKADYVITGNVLNGPGNMDPLDTMKACGLMLKQGGRSIHLLDSGEVAGSSKPLAPILSDAKAIASCGQGDMRMIPPGEYNPGGATKAVILEQQTLLPPPSVQAEEVEHGGQLGKRGQTPD